MTTKNLNEISELLTSLRELKWDPNWLNCKKVDDGLINAIKDFQSQHFLEPTGIIDSVTYRILYNLYGIKKHSASKNKKELEASKHLFYNSKPLNSRILVYNHVYNTCLKPNASSFDPYDDHKQRDISQINVIYDYCLNTEIDTYLSLHLKHSTHFQIDNDGSIYQNLDLHCIPFNRMPYLTVDERITISIANIVIPAMLSWYEKNDIPREIYKNKIQMNHKQNFSLNQLLDTLNKYFSIKNTNYCY